MEKDLRLSEQRAWETYPYFPTEVNLFGHKTITADGNSHYRGIYIKGYEQAEKDLGWISVKDRLPEVGHFVLTCLSGTGTPQCVGMALLLEDGTWWDGDMKVRVDYWMEVPRLKEEQK